ncbi:MAG TPA: M23 family metallopeptidase [Spirochaetota bacterium]|nr:M23 family metallopeptidase [Spirochaetota bacterium]HNT11362.1 M23 family metallopeptidase [Spirochaetota bacterium]
MTAHTAATLAAVLLAWSAAFADGSRSGIRTLSALDPSNPAIQTIRNDIRTTLAITKGRGNPTGLPELTFYRYTVARGDTLWSILAKSGLNIDTLVAINGLSSPSQVRPGVTLFIPNMRGIIIDTHNRDTLDGVAAHHRIAPVYLAHINRCAQGVRRYLFVPNAQLSSLERSLFLGTGFYHPFKNERLTKGRISSGFGNRIDPIQKSIKFHSGVDIACPVGTRVYAARSGEVVFAGTRGGYGQLIIIKHPHDYYSYYGHLQRIMVRTGDRVTTRQQIALSGNTGRTTGPHLHFEIRKNTKPVNPDVLARLR